MPTLDELLLELARYLDRLTPLIALAVVALAASHPGERFSRAVWRRLGRISRRAWTPPLAAGAVSLMVGLPLIALREPQPRVHDEFSYLLAADTFASGRLTNPTHKVWPAFETFHVLHVPSYASKYPPGQGLLLAAGQVVTGYPVAGAWAGAAMACAAVAWMLLARLPARWALLGGVLTAVHPRVLDWAQNYWGGQLAMLGGALLLGSALRITRREATVPTGLAAGLGLSILALSRPSEGLIFSLVIFVWLLIHFLRRGVECRALLRRGVLPAGCVLAPVLAWLGYYHFRVTGSVLIPPYVEHIWQYAVAPPFWWQSIRPEPEFRGDVIRGLQVGWELPYWQRHQTPLGFAFAIAAKLYVLARDGALFGVLALPVIAAVASWRRSRLIRKTTVLLGFFLAVVVLNQTWAMTHYVAPAAGLLAMLVVLGMRRLRQWKRQSGTGRVLARAVVVLALLAGVRFSLEAVRSWGWQYDRQTLIRELEAGGGRHLVVVRYEPGHDIMREWVANSADIDAQSVVFARELDPCANRRLVDYFSTQGRVIWLLEPDRDFFRLVPYP